MEHLLLLRSWHQDPILEQEICQAYPDLLQALITLKLATMNIDTKY